MHVLLGDFRPPGNSNLIKKSEKDSVYGRFHLNASFKLAGHGSQSV